MSRAAAALIVRLAATLLPPGMKGWGQAMRCEAEALAPGEALPFALGCLGAALREAATFHLLRPLPQPEPGTHAMSLESALLGRPRRVTALCAVAATGLGLSYMSLGGAPARYLAMNTGALILGLLITSGILWSARTSRIAPGAISLALGIALLLTSLFGASVEGATRWIAISNISIQPSLILLPMMVIGFARTRDWLSTAAIAVAALALALQPDRAMSGSLAAGVAALALFRPERTVLTALATALAGFATAMLRPDTQGAMPYVDQILYSSFDIHPLAGACVLAGAALMLVPALIGVRHDPARREVHAVFGAVWFAVLAAAALGNYPTPLVGYGGSAIIGYLFSLIALPSRAAPANAGASDAVRPDETDHQLLRIALT